MTLAQQNFLTPSFSWVDIVVFVVILVLTVGPLIETATRGRWGWFWATLIFGPFAGIGWLVAGRNDLRH